MELGNIYYYTASITKWRNLLKPDKYKLVIIDSLAYLVQQCKIAVYGFVLMPNHIHLIWEMLEMNGKEMPHASFMKFTAKSIQKDLRIFHPLVLEKFKVESNTKDYHFWKREALPFHLYTPELIYQKLNYIHNNPCQGKWMLASNPLEYKFSSAKFYETGIDDFGFLSHIGNRL